MRSRLKHNYVFKGGIKFCWFSSWAQTDTSGGSAKERCSPTMPEERLSIGTSEAAPCWALVSVRYKYTAAGSPLQLMAGHSAAEQ